MRDGAVELLLRMTDVKSGRARSVVSCRVVSSGVHTDDKEDTRPDSKQRL